MFINMFLTHVNILDVHQSDSHSITDLYHMWLTLQQDPLLETHCDVMNKCCKQALTLEHLVASTLPG